MLDRTWAVVARGPTWAMVESRLAVGRIWVLSARTWARKGLISARGDPTWEHSARTLALSVPMSVLNGPVWLVEITGLCRRIDPTSEQIGLAALETCRA